MKKKNQAPVLNDDELLAEINHRLYVSYSHVLDKIYLILKKREDDKKKCQWEDHSGPLP